MGVGFLDCGGVGWAPGRPTGAEVEVGFGCSASSGSAVADRSTALIRRRFGACETVLPRASHVLLSQAAILADTVEFVTTVEKTSERTTFPAAPPALPSNRGGTDGGLKPPAPQHKRTGRAVVYDPNGYPSLIEYMSRVCAAVAQISSANILMST